MSWNIRMKIRVMKKVTAFKQRIFNRCSNNLLKTSFAYKATWLCRVGNFDTCNANASNQIEETVQNICSYIHTFEYNTLEHRGGRYDASQRCGPSSDISLGSRVRQRVTLQTRTADFLFYTRFVFQYPIANWGCVGTLCLWSSIWIWSTGEDRRVKWRRL